MHKIQVAFGMATSDAPVPVRVILDDHELQGVQSVEVKLDDEGVTSVVLTLVASTVEDNKLLERTTKREGTA